MEGRIIHLWNIEMMDLLDELSVPTRKSSLPNGTGVHSAHRLVIPYSMRCSGGLQGNNGCFDA